jgi:hypothetical protein
MGIHSVIFPKWEAKEIRNQKTWPSKPKVLLAMSWLQLSATKVGFY